MRFDDRITTALAQSATVPHDRAVRWRQLVDLVARWGGQAEPDLLDRAIAVIRADAGEVEERLRAAAARAIAGMPAPVALLTVFAADRLTVAAPVLAAADLAGEDLEKVRAAATDEVRRFLDSLRPPQRGSEPSARREPKPDVIEKTEQVPSLGEVVARIERLRETREQARVPQAGNGHGNARANGNGNHAGQPPANGSSSLFRWECSPSGEIDWVEGAPRGPLVGRTIAAADPAEGVDRCVEQAFGVRAPFRDCLLELGEEGPLAGHWVISGVPAFAPGDGRFIGYRGIARRGDPELHVAPANNLRAGSEAEPADHDALREMIHEIRTPLNAIIGFAEIIDGQYLGPAHSRYRQRAAEIVANARSLLVAAEDLDFAARLQTVGRKAGDGTDFASFFPPFADDLLERAARLGVVIDLDAPDKGGRCTIGPELTERLLRRFTDAVLLACEPGERLAVHVHRFDTRCGMSITRPRATMMAGKHELLDPEFTIGGADRSLLGIGFSMRLINGLVGIAGGGLDISDEHFTLYVPMELEA